MAYEEGTDEPVMSNFVADDAEAPAEDANASGASQAETEQEGNAEQAEKDHVAKIIRDIRLDKRHHAKAFKRMRRDMFIATNGRDETWAESNYKANIAGRHVKNKVATLYAKNPKATARRAEKLDFALWDEDPQSLMQATMAVAQGQAMAAQHAQAQAAVMAAQPPADPMAAALMGHNGAPVMQPEPFQMPPQAVEGAAVLADFQQGMERRKTIDKVGKTLEILFARALRNQQPIDFKAAAKQCVRRASTTGVGYAELTFQREYGPRPGLDDELTDIRTRLDHLRVLAEQVQEGEVYDCDAEMDELQRATEALQQEPEVLVREGLIFDWPKSTKVIPDRLCKELVGFVGSRHVTIEYEYTVPRAKELFDVDLSNCAKFTEEGHEFSNIVGETYDETGAWSRRDKDSGLVRVWKRYDKLSGLVYYVADGYDKFLKPPAAPDVFVDTFWPVYALTFNDVENETEIFPPSDVALIHDMQMELNRSRQGKREHREAARPRWAYANGLFEDEDVDRLRKVKPFDAIGLNMDPSTDIAKVIQRFPIPGVDPNLYDTNEVMTDAQFVVGAQEAQLGGTSSKSSATEAAIAAGTTNSIDSSSVDDLDAFITELARASGMVLLREMSEESVKQIVGPGAVWPHMQLSEIAEELYLTIEAGSMGKPNQQVEVNNWKQMLPLLIQMGGIKPLWLAKETLRRLDDRMDLTDAVADGIPSIAQMNAIKQPGAAGAEQNPAAQGGQGAQNAQKGPSEVQPGSDAPMGNNRV
ncbi:hypothetical protein [Bradyrhizobium sp.]|jgi:hypothetical protein|uniref:hypothetical protein n=1 Tax=Bradyrhizobium sp. TaxID=376 RepID=UPI002DDDB5C6|nr:hypothetical protein [Bradyrhizobium sp.]HEV2155413.1 hypothetical protein [Bradyrhizobium sp.]